MADSYPFQYTIIGGNDSPRVFTLNSTSGQLSLSSTMDHIVFRDQYRIVVEGRSLSDPLVFGNVVIIFSLSPKNDGSTNGFTKEEYLFTVSNETAIGEVFGYVYVSVCNISSDSMNTSPPTVNYSISNVSGGRAGGEREGEKERGREKGRRECRQKGEGEKERGRERII